MCILNLQHMSVWTSHISGAQKPYVASGYHSTVEDSRISGERRDVVNRDSLDSLQSFR